MLLEFLIPPNLNESKKWIQSAIKKKGSLRQLAKAEGALKKDGTISKEWLRKKSKSRNKTVARRARLASTLNKMK